MSRFWRSPVRAPWLVFLAVFGALAWLVPHRPRAVIQSGSPDFVHVIGFSPDGQLLATCDDEPGQAGAFKRDLSVDLWDVSPGGNLGRVAVRRGTLLPHLAWSWVDDPGRRWLFWECMKSESPDARLRELLHGRPDGAYAIDPTETPHQLRISGDGQFLAVREGDGTFSIRDRESDRVQIALPNISDPPVFGPEPAAVTFISPSDQAGGRVVVSRDARTGRELRRQPVAMDSRRRATLSCDGHWLVGERNGGSVVQKTLDGRCAELQAPDRGPNPRVLMIDRWRLVPSGPWLVHVVSFAPPVGATMRTFDVIAGQAIATFTPRTDHPIDLQIAAVSSDGRQVALRESLPSLGHSAWLPAFIASAYEWLRWRIGGPTMTSALWVVDVATGASIARLPVGEECRGNGATNEGVAAFSPDRRQLAVAGEQGAVSIWDGLFPRPWLWIVGWALVPALVIAGLGMIGRHRKGSR